jgi:hypothetical protein
MWYNYRIATVSYLDRFLDPISDVFTPEMARKIVELRAEPELQARVDALASKSNEGTLSDEEDAEYKSYVEAADIIGIFQSKARRFLAQHP